MQYLIEDTHNFQMLTSTMEKVKKYFVMDIILYNREANNYYRNKSKMPIDMKFLLHCIEKQRMSVALAMVCSFLLFVVFLLTKY